MSSTRRAAPGTPPRQERFASSPQFEKGLMGNLVARRCEVIADKKQGELIWFLQGLSHELGLEKVAAELIAKYPERIATRSMQKFGFKPGQIYNAEQVRAVRKEINGNRSMLSPCQRFPLKGEGEKVIIRACGDPDLAIKIHKAECHQARLNADEQPAHYPAHVFLEKCQEASGKLENLLSDLCLDPAFDMDAGGPFYFPTLIETLHEYQTAWIESKCAGAVVTEIGRAMFETLEYCMDTGRLVLIEGEATTGKTIASQHFCHLHPGQVRYVQVPSGNDDMGFFRAIAKELGVSINITSKAQQLRNRIEDVLQKSKLGIIFDSAHFLWPQSNYRDTTPGRINWVLSALVEKGVPVALISTPIFMRMMAEIESKCVWDSQTLRDKLDTHQKLPGKLQDSDLTAIAKTFLPNACALSIETVVLHAKTSAKGLGAIVSAATRAAHNAAKANRETVTFEDVRGTVKGVSIPSDNATALALGEPRKTSRSRSIAAIPPAHCSAPATASQPIRDTAPLPPERTQILTVENLADAHRARLDTEAV